MLAVTMAAAMATLVTLAPFRIKLRKPTRTPYLSLSTALRIELELGE
jgi:hypothetical protein